MVLFPKVCDLCGAFGESPCGACERGLPRPPSSEPAPAELDDLVALVAYEGSGRELVAKMKYRNRRDSLDWAARRLSARLRTTTPSAVVTWVPASPSGLARRGFDCGELLARRIGHELGIPVRRLLSRRDVRPQHERSLAARASGPSLQVAWWSRRWGLGPPSSVLVVDDVVTTGASISEAALALRAAGARRVTGAAIARTPLRVARPVA